MSTETASLSTLEYDAYVVAWNAGYQSPNIKGKMNFVVDNVIIHDLYDIPRCLKPKGHAMDSTVV